MPPAVLPRAAHPRRAANWRRRTLIGLVILYLGVLVLAPLAALLLSALQQGLPVIIAALSEWQALRAFGLTLLIALIAVVIHGVCGTALAWVLVRQRFAGQRLVNALIDLPFAISPVVTGYTLLLLFGRRGLFAPLLERFDLQVAFALPGMILATLFVTLPFMARELMPLLVTLGIEEEQAAHTLGASGWQTFRWVTLPALRYGLIYGLLLTFARAVGEFGAVLVVGGGVQGRTETATVYIYRALEDRQYAGAYGAALVLGLLSLLLVIVAERLPRLRRW